MLSLVRQSVCCRLFAPSVTSLPLRTLSTKCILPATYHLRNQSLLTVKPHHLLICRYKSKGKSKVKQQQSQSDSEEDTDKLEGEVVDKHTKVQKINVTSLRVDAILKNALGIARNKIETMFYESKIRVNGDKIAKKSISAKEGDEIDVIKGYNQSNTDMLVVARVEILSATPNEDSITLKIRRSKSLIIENYPDKWQGSA